MMNFTETIKNALLAKGKTQADLGEYLGLTASSISLKIRLKRNLYVEEFYKMCIYLNLDPDQLFSIYCDDLRRSATKRDGVRLTK